jgi:GT2 family glycosyltransferase
MALSPPLDLTASIVVFNTPIADIAQLISDLLGQGVARVYVVDNSPAAFDSLGGWTAPQNCTYLRTGRNLGYGRAHNLAIRECSTSKYHLICNPDITLSPTVITELFRFMELHQDIGVCMPKLVGADGQTQHCCRRSPVAWDYVSQIIFRGSWGARRLRQLEMRDHDYNAEMDVECLSGCFMFFRSDVLAKIKGFDESFFLYFEDFDLSMRARERARNVYAPSSSVVHGRQSAHRRSWRLKLAFAVSGIRYFLKWRRFARS